MGRGGVPVVILSVLALALALPDMCADPEGVGGNQEQRVIKWLKKNRTHLALQSLHSGTGIRGANWAPRGTPAGCHMCSSVQTPSSHRE